MNQEVEFKFNVGSRRIFDKIIKSKEINGFKVKTIKKEKQFDDYYDSKNLMLLKNGSSFRIRYNPKMNQYSAWYKRTPQIRSSSRADRFTKMMPKTGGLFIRDEIGVEIDQKEIKKIKKGISKTEPFKLVNKTLKGLPIRKVLRIINYRITLFLEKGDQRVELDLDNLIFQKGKKRKKDYEIELENKSALLTDFKKLANHLEKKLNLTPSQLSKYVKGIKLLKKDKQIQEFDLEDGIKKTIERIKELKEKLDRTIIIAVAGGSASGKTSKVVKKILEEIPQAKMISLDDYYRGKKYMTAHPEINWEMPEALDLGLLASHLNQLKNGKIIQKPKYSMKISDRIGDEEFSPAEIIIIEGLFALEDILASQSDLNVFVEIGTHGRLMRRLLRDAGREGRTGDSFKKILEYFLSTVQPMHEIYIEPLKNKADIIIHNEYSPSLEAEKSERFEAQIKFAGNISDEQIIALGAEKLGVVYHKDRYYFPIGKSVTETKEILRIRDENNEYLLTYKGPPLKAGIRVKAKLDIPIDKEDIKLIEKEYQPILKINKQRKIFKLENISIVVDEVENLGSFVELSSSSRQDEEKIKNLAKKLKLDKPLKESYFELMTKNQHNKITKR